MHPILFKFGPITIYTYGLVLFIAVFVSLNLLVREAQKRGFNKDTIYDLGIILLVSGIIGARILYIFLNLDFYLENPKEIFMLHHGGLAILGGIVAALLACWIFVKMKKLSFLEIADLVIPYVALGEAIGRIGCFFNGCCYGVPWKFGIYFPVHKAVLIPTQLISSFLSLILFMILRLRQTKPHYLGAILASYIAYYATLRFFVEFIRGDSPRLFFNLTFFQYLCIILFFIANLFHIFLRLRPPKNYSGLRRMSP